MMDFFGIGGAISGAMAIAQQEADRKRTNSIRRATMILPYPYLAAWSIFLAICMGLVVTWG